jgi:glycosyltransferase involved in cell wall biosynthesis
MVSHQVVVYDPTTTDEQSRVRGVGRYLQILQENFPEWTYTNDFSVIEQLPASAIFLNPFFNPFQPPLNTKKIIAKQLTVVHDLIPVKYPAHFPAGIKGKLNLLANKKMLEQSLIIITDSEASKQDIKEKFKIPETKIKVIYPCLPQIFTKSEKEKKPTNYQLPTTDYCLYVGDATWNKNLVNLAKAIKAADVTCVFVGKVFGQINRLTKVENAWQKELVEFFILARGDPRFVFAGFISDQELIALYKNARANLLVSRDEGFGFSYLEAASQQTPSLLADIPVLHEISQDAALFVDEQKPETIAEKIRALMSTEELRQTLGQEAKERLRFFSGDKFKKDFLSLL